MGRGIIAIVFVASILLGGVTVSAQSPGLREAQAAYSRLPAEKRFMMAFSLMVTGQYVGMADGNMGPRLFEAVRRFQAENNLTPDGIVTPNLAEFASAQARPVLNLWGLRVITHPATGAQIMAPVAYTPIQTVTRRGLAFEHPDKRMSVDFAFYPTEEVPLHALYQRFSTPGANRQVGYKVLREKFFAVAGRAGDRGFYARFEATNGGAVGFTLSWQDAALHGDRLSTLMSNSLVTRPAGSSPAPLASAPMPLSPPGASPPQVAVAPPVLPPALPPASAVPPTAPPSPPRQEPKPAQILTGSGFFVSNEGDILTNSHVVAGCGEALILEQGAARVVARDNRNDLALLRLKTVSAERKPVSIKFRTGAVQLGESTFVLGYPLAGRLDNGLNFTNGMVSAVSGIDNDTSNFQMTAPIQPGNSGGPIVDKSGALIGVVVSTLRQSENSRTVPQNVNFGIKADTAATFLRTNGVEPATALQGEKPIEPTAIAAEGRKQTVQVVCFPN